jgi:ABC-2 type transport system permease protein
VTRWQQTLEVARWEFQRFVKWKQQLIGLGILLAMGLAGGMIGRAAKRAELKPVPVAVVGAERLDFALPAAAPVVWDSGQRWTLDSARAALTDKRLGGILIVNDARDLRLLVRSKSEWSETLEAALVGARQQALLVRAAQSSPEGAALLSTLAFEIALLEGAGARSDAATRIAAIAILFLGFTLMLGGFGTLFTGITGEKQHRVTEQLVAIVPPQVWMDGKIIGLTGASFVGTVLTAGGMLVLAKILPGALGFPALRLPAVASDWPLLALITVITLLGVLMWFAFMSAIAATIDDPNSSMRTLLLFVPMLPAGIGFAMVSKLDTTLAQVLAIVPLTSSAVLPLRLVVTTVPWWEVVLALALLAATAWAFRRLAGKIFGTGVLMYGKEPTLREMLRWMRRA